MTWLVFGATEYSRIGDDPQKMTVLWGCEASRIIGKYFFQKLYF